jgi:putative nucleotidyltransferase with HDIG domain
MATVTMLSSELKPGMIIAEDIYSSDYILLIAKNTIINKSIIEKFIQLNIAVVSVMEDINKAEPIDSIYERDRKQFIQIYENSLSIVRHLVDDVRLGNNIDIDSVKESAQALLSTALKNNSIIGRLRLVKNKDEYTYTHSVNVALLAMMIGNWMKLPELDIYQLGCAGLLHDIGKAKIEDDVLNKPSKLSAEEFARMKRHTIEGFKLLCEIPGLPGDVMFAALSHHERFDGQGYPLELKGEHTHLYARIIAVADVYDAMTSKRIYRDKVSPFLVAKQIINDRFGILDPRISQIFLDNICNLYVGARVELSSGLVGDVIFIDPNIIDRPIIACEHGIIDLKKITGIEIVDIVG